MINFKWLTKLFFRVCLLVPVAAQARQDVVDGYVREGFRSNIVLQQKQVSLQKAVNALQVAKSMYLPAISFQAAYQSGQGGRSIDLPVGDLLNPVYSSLNQLTGTENFPQIANVSQTFFPNNFYDAKLHTAVPILNTDLGYNKKIQEAQLGIQEFEVIIYKRELAKDIKAAYYNYLSAHEAIGIYESAAMLAAEGRRVNEALLKNGKGLPAYVLRANAEAEQVDAQLNAARLNAANAAAYFNFLLNKPASSDIAPDSQAKERLASVMPTGEVDTPAAGREELKALDKAVAISETADRMNRNFWVPRINGFIDVGSQAEGFRFNSNARYYLAGI
ncbi:TolC family protein [Pedobacter sp. SYP-B3415]|uniref:TolC family protein n=1 Tax=Pedobacter sp. SYP-B3415 TaxID=2496641 RepID=UPI001F0DCA74|nr:TolC family protein [Pedobacter sp. SYP-B3415]